MSTEQVMDDLIDVHEVARLYGVHPVTIRKWIRTGAIPSTRLPNGYVRVSRAWVEQAIREMGEEASKG